LAVGEEEEELGEGNTSSGPRAQTSCDMESGEWVASSVVGSDFFMSLSRQA
jgi:hypothetical protein